MQIWVLLKGGFCLVPTGGTAPATSTSSAASRTRAVCTEEASHTEDRSPAPAGASASPCLALYICWWVSANKGPQRHPLKWSEPKTHLPAGTALQDLQTDGARPCGAAGCEKPARLTTYDVSIIRIYACTHTHITRTFIYMYKTMPCH